MNLTDPVTAIPGVGEKYKKLLQKINVETVNDLLYHIPRRYLDIRNAQKIKTAKMTG